MVIFGCVKWSAFCKYFWKLLSYFKIIDFEQWPCCVWNVKQLWRYCWCKAYLMIANSLYLQSKVESNTSQMMWGVRKRLELFLWQKYFTILQVAKFFKLFQLLSRSSSAIQVQKMGFVVCKVFAKLSLIYVNQWKDLDKFPKSGN